MPRSATFFGVVLGIALSTIPANGHDASSEKAEIVEKQLAVKKAALRFAAAQLEVARVRLADCGMVVEQQTKNVRLWENSKRKLKEPNTGVVDPAAPFDDDAAEGARLELAESKARFAVVEKETLLGTARVESARIELDEAQARHKLLIAPQTPATRQRHLDLSAKHIAVKAAAVKIATARSEVARARLNVARARVPQAERALTHLERAMSRLRKDCVDQLLLVQVETELARTRGTLAEAKLKVVDAEKELLLEQARLESARAELDEVQTRHKQWTAAQTPLTPEASRRQHMERAQKHIAVKTAAVKIAASQLEDARIRLRVVKLGVSQAELAEKRFEIEVSRLRKLVESGVIDEQVLHETESELEGKTRELAEEKSRVAVALHEILFESTRLELARAELEESQSCLRELSAEASRQQRTLLAEKHIAVKTAAVKLATFQLEAARIRLDVMRADAFQAAAQAKRWEIQVARLRREIERGVVDSSVFLETERQLESVRFAFAVAKARVAVAEQEVLLELARLESGFAELAESQARLRAGPTPGKTESILLAEKHIAVTAAAVKIAALQLEAARARLKVDRAAEASVTLSVREILLEMARRESARAELDEAQARLHWLLKERGK